MPLGLLMSDIETGLTKASVAFWLSPLSVRLTCRREREDITVEPVAGQTAKHDATVVRC